MAIDGQLLRPSQKNRFSIMIQLLEIASVVRRARDRGPQPFACLRETAELGQQS